MNEDTEIRKLAKDSFDRFSFDKSALSWTAWKKAYYLAYKTGLAEGMQYLLDKMKTAE